jgi:hypothetical protein
MRGFQCHKNLYLHVHHPELEPEIDEAQQAIFDQGTQVGLVAQEYYPNGIAIKIQPGNPTKAVDETLQAIQSGAHTIYEATFLYKNIQVKVDILHKPKKSQKWQFIEVKSSTTIKEVHLEDLAVQAWVAEGAGLKVASYHLMYLNNECVFPNLKNLFNIDDVTKEISIFKKTTPAKVKEIKKILSSSKIPNVDIGPHCEDPYECPFQAHCWKEKKIPEISVFNLYGIGKKKWSYYEKKILKFKDLPVGDLSTVQKRIVDCFSTKKRFVNAKGIAKDLASWKFPLYYLDFETINYAIPKHKGTRPYMQVPFQFSCHIETASGKISHREYLHEDKSDPRPPFIESLLDAVGSTGSVVSYNKGFEAGIMEALAKSFPKHATKLRAIMSRLVDPLPIMRANVYDTAFLDSFSIKAVAPTLIGKKLSYENLMVSDGTIAQDSYVQMIEGSAPQSEKVKIRKAMLEYCHLDTLAMVEIVKWLRNV